MKLPKDTIIADIETGQVVIHFRSAHVREQAEVERIMRDIEEVMQVHKFDVMVLNFTRVKMLTSGFLGKMVMLHKRLNEQNMKLRTCCMDPTVYEAFRVCKLQKLIPVFKTEDEAVK